MNPSTALESVLRSLNPDLEPRWLARPFLESDRDPLMSLMNAESRWALRIKGADWRAADEAQQLHGATRVTVEAADGVVAYASMSNASALGADGAMAIRLFVAMDSRRRGIRSALLRAFEQEARQRAVPSLLGAVSVSVLGSLPWARRCGFT